MILSDLDSIARDEQSEKNFLNSRFATVEDVRQQDDTMRILIDGEEESSEVYYPAFEHVQAQTGDRVMIERYGDSGIIIMGVIRNG